MRPHQIERLTPSEAQAATLSYIIEFRATWKRTPKYREIAERFGFCTTTASNHVTALQRLGE